MITGIYHLMASRKAQGIVLSNTVTINVWYQSCQRPYQLDRHCTIAELRQQVARDHSIKVSEVKILLGGSMLADQLTIEGSGIGMESTLFAIQQKLSAVAPPLSSSPDTAASLEGRDYPLQAEIPSSAGSDLVHPTQQGSGEYEHQLEACHAVVMKEDNCRQLRDQYFVYCKICEDVQPGRLRVKCSVCNGGAVLVDKGPSCWDDVLTPGRVLGTCQTAQCKRCLPEFYFKCAEQHGGEVGRTVVILRHIRPNRNSIPCITCEDILSPVVVFPCQSSHVMCLDCFRTYCTVRLQERQFYQSQQYGYTLPCPANCPNSLIQEQHHFCIMGKREYDRYKDFAAEECLLAEGGMYCPRKDCGSGFMVEAADTRIVCPHCRFLFCRLCREAVHDGECRPVSQASEPVQGFSDPERAERAQWDQQSADRIRETTKGCPGCNTRTEHDGGCMHMKCTRCGENWCWFCVKPWDRECQGAHWFG